MILGLSIYFIVMDFYIFAFAGWIYESIFDSIRSRKPVNRGFLVGPILPLYGCGAVLVYVLLRPFAAYGSLLYVMGMVIATVLEYITSWLMEVLFHTKWWDYSQEPYNLNGRIALIPSMFWGILSLLMFDVFQPAASWIIRQIPRQAGNILLLVLLVITALDIVYSVIMTVNFRKQLEKLYEFRKELEYLLEDLEFPSPREFLSSTARELSGKFTAESFSEYKEAFYQKLASVKGNSAENDSKRALAEERLRFYWENRSRFLKKRPVIGNQRLLDAFPGMKILSKNHTAIEVKELLLMIRQKTNSLDRHRKQEKE